MYHHFSKLSDIRALPGRYDIKKSLTCKLLYKENVGYKYSMSKFLLYKHIHHGVGNSLILNIFMT